MFAPREAPEHGRRIGIVDRLAQDRVAEQNERVGREHPVFRMAPRGGARLFCREAPGRGATRFRGSDRLVDFGGKRLERNSEASEDFRAAGGGGGEDHP
jgi:hypothetical protein